MPRPRLEVPTYRLHKPTGKAVCTVYDAAGDRREVVLGDHGSAASKAEYARLCAELRPGGVMAGVDLVVPVAEIVAAYLTHAKRYYRHPDGTSTGEAEAIRYALRPLRKLYGPTPAAEFGPKSLKALQQHMAELRWSRKLVNARIGRVVRMFKWAVGEELVAAAVYGGLRAVSGLQAGRSAARETDDVLPVPAADYETTLPFLPFAPRALVELMRWTGMRPGEACRVTLAEIDRTGDVWVYAPKKHKTAYKGKKRAVAFGPKAQAVLAAFLAAYEKFDLLAADPTAPVFSPARERQRLYAERRAKRVSKVQPSQKDRKKPGKRRPGAVYRSHGLAVAVRRAAKKAGVTPWHPNQLRHLVGTEVREKHGLEAAQVVLGHSRADITQLYALTSTTKAAAVAADMG